MTAAERKRLRFLRTLAVNTYWEWWEAEDRPGQEGWETWQKSTDWDTLLSTIAHLNMQLYRGR